MSLPRRSRRPVRARRPLGVLTLALALLLLTASSAVAFATFPTAGNPTGSVENPYPRNSPQTLKLTVPYDGGILGITGKPTQIRVRIPAGWTNPQCGATSIVTSALLQLELLSAWSCAVSTSNGATTLTWSGGGLTLTVPTNSRQQVTFTVTTPDVATTTSFGAADSTAPGFSAQTNYVRLLASASKSWKAPNAPGGDAGEVSTDLVRTVAGPPPPEPPLPCAQLTVRQECIRVTVPEIGDGEFVWSIDGNDHSVTLNGGQAQASYLQYFGSIEPVLVVDTRASKPPWSVSGQIVNVTGGIAPAAFGWTPFVENPSGAGFAGPAVPSGYSTGAGLSSPRVLGQAPGGHALGSARLGAGLDLRLPLETAPGTYAATLTLTAMG